MTKRGEFVSTISNGEPGAAQYEFVPDQSNPKAIYIVFGDRRIATRRRGRWVSLVPGYKVRDTGDPDGIEILFTGG